MKLDDKVALITGAAGGIGLAAARRFADEGAVVILIDLDEAALAAAAKEIGNSANFMVADVAEPQAMANVVRTTVERHGRIDVFVANAGIEGAIVNIVDCPVETFDRVMAVNVRGVWLGLKYVFPVMKEQGGGSIVVTSSAGGIRGTSAMAHYIASKHAVIGLVRAAAHEGAPDHIRVNSVNPGPVETRMMRSIESGQAPGAPPDQVKASVAAGVPLKRYAEPCEVASLMLFLASGESSYCTGGVYTVDGGLTA